MGFGEDVRIRTLLFLLLLPFSLLAQRGIAPSGYYPRDFRGDTFTGKVISTDTAADTITLQFDKKDKPELLTVTLEGGCYVPSKTGAPMHAANIPVATVLKMLYVPKGVQKDGKKELINFAVGISFIEWNGKVVSDPEHRLIHRCGPKGGFLHYRAYDRRPGAASLSPLQLTIPND